MKRLTAKDILTYPDGTWIETDADITRVLHTWPWNEPRPGSAVYLWRRKQLLDQLEYAQFLREVE